MGRGPRTLSRGPDEGGPSEVPNEKIRLVEGRVGLGVLSDTGLNPHSGRRGTVGPCGSSVTSPQVTPRSSGPGLDGRLTETRSVRGNDSELRRRLYPQTKVWSGSSWSVAYPPVFRTGHRTPRVKTSSFFAKVVTVPVELS